jgi:hypothetical protein
MKVRHQSIPAVSRIGGMHKSQTQVDIVRVQQWNRVNRERIGKHDRNYISRQELKSFLSPWQQILHITGTGLII